VEKNMTDLPDLQLERWIDGARREEQAFTVTVTEPLYMGTKREAKHIDWPETKLQGKEPFRWY